MITKKMIKKWKQQIAEIKPKLNQAQKAQVLTMVIEAYLDGYDDGEAIRYGLRYA